MKGKIFLETEIEGAGCKKMKYVFCKNGKSIHSMWVDPSYINGLKKRIKMYKDTEPYYFEKDSDEIPEVLKKCSSPFFTFPNHYNIYLFSDKYVYPKQKEYCDIKGDPIYWPYSCQTFYIEFEDGSSEILKYYNNNNYERQIVNENNYYIINLENMLSMSIEELENIYTFKKKPIAFCSNEELEYLRNKTNIFVT